MFDIIQSEEENVCPGLPELKKLMSWYQTKVEHRTLCTLFEDKVYVTYFARYNPGDDGGRSGKEIQSPTSVIHPAVGSVLSHICHNGHNSETGQKKALDSCQNGRSVAMYHVSY